MPDPLTVHCPAKLNLFLEVLPRRPDGYHDLDTVMIPLDFGDTLQVRSSRETSLRISPSRSVAVRGNSIFAALRALKTHTGFSRPVSLRLQKRIPTGGGLGGGSSDAAMTLRAVNRLFRLRLPANVLQRCAEDVGSDVPFFLQDGPAHCTGRGEIVVPLPNRSPLHFVLLFPGKPVPTPEAYALLDRLPRRPKISSRSVRRRWKTAAPSELEELFHNDFEVPARQILPQLIEEAARLRRHGLRPHLSGSGSTLFALCLSRADAARIASNLNRETPGSAQAASG